MQRILQKPDHSFFLFGPRSVGKSFWLRQYFTEDQIIDLLEHKTQLELSRDPSMLEARIGKKPQGTWVCIDEIQKIPALLDEVHRLMQKSRFRFALSGSSARKLKRGGANLLAGRAVTLNMEGFSYAELGERFGSKHVLEWGTLPIVVLNLEQAPNILSAYIHTYIKEEIKEEGVVRKVEPFLRFLEIAGIYNAQQINKDNIAREAKVPRSTVDIYFSILEDTLLGHFLPAFRPEVKVRERAHPKFYWFDPGVARGAANLLFDPPNDLWLGRSLETYLLHELRVYNHVSGKNRPLSFYCTPRQSEIDFVIETRKRTSQNKVHVVCVEAKYSKNWNRAWEKPMRALASEGKLIVEKMVAVYLGDIPYHFDGLDVLPLKAFLDQLFKGKIF